MPVLDADAYRAALGKALQAELREAARAWLRAVIPLVPVWSGEARGSLRPLGQFLREAVPITPVAKTSRIGAGESAQHFEFSDSGGVYSFEWATSVLHYILNEFYESALPLTNPTPWHSTAAGEAAFRDYVDKVLPTRIPGAEAFLTTQVVTLT